MALTSARRVRRLHLHASHADDVSPAATLLSDALHTATIPAADDGRLVVIQRLALGRISTRVSAASLALHIERLTREALNGAVSYDLPAAARAPVVAFRSRGEAIVALARRHTRHLDSSEWFWDAVIPGWRRHASRSGRWMLLLEAAGLLDERLVVAGRIAADAVDDGVEEELWNALSTVTGARWLDRIAGDPTDADRPGGRRVALPSAHLAVVQRWQRRCGGVEVRVLWLGTVLAVHENRALAGEPALPSIVAGMLRGTDAPTPIAAAVRPNSRVPAPERVNSGRPRQSVVAAQEQVRASPAAEPSPDRLGGVPSLWEPTTHAGLLYVIPLLERLGLPGYVRDHPDLLDARFPESLVQLVGRRTGLPPDDPLYRAFEYDEAVVSACVDEVHELPPVVRDLLAQPVPRGSLGSRCDPWLVAMRRWCRRHLRMGLMTLVRRRGMVSVTDTHLEASFDLSRIDVRIRRLALDVDPGWVPWLGRVVQFRYVDRRG